MNHKLFPILILVLSIVFPGVAAGQKIRDDAKKLMYSAKTSFAERQYSSAFSHCSAAFEIAKNTEIALSCAFYAQYNEDDENCLRFSRLAGQLAKKDKNLAKDETLRDMILFYEGAALLRLNRIDEAQKTLMLAPRKSALLASSIQNALALIHSIKHESVEAVRILKNNYRENEEKIENIEIDAILAAAYFRMGDEEKSELHAGRAALYDVHAIFLNKIAYIPKSEAFLLRALMLTALGRNERASNHLDHFLERSASPQDRILVEKFKNKKLASSARLDVFPLPPKDMRLGTISADKKFVFLASSSGRLAMIDVETNQGKILTDDPSLGAFKGLCVDKKNTMRAFSDKYLLHADLDADKFSLYSHPFDNVTPVSFDALCEDTLALSDTHIVAFTKDLRHVEIEEISEDTRTILKDNVITTLSHDRKIMALAYGHFVILVDLKTGDKIADFRAPFKITALSASPTRNIFAFSTLFGAGILDEKAHLLRIFGAPDQSAVHSASFTSDGDKFVVVSDNNIEIWSLKILGV